MKICHLTSVHSLDDTRILHKECQSLAKHGHDVYLVGFGTSQISKGVNIIGLDDKPTTRLKRISLGARRVVHEGLKLDCDVYHLHDPELILYIPLLRRKGKKVIFDSHEDVPAQIFEKDWLPMRSLISRVYTWVEKYYLKKANALVYVTPSMEQRMREINQNSSLVTNYPILDLDMTNDYNPVKDRDYLCFIGGISSKWNHDAVIQALQNVDGVVYALYGKPSSEAYMEHLKNIDNAGVLDYRGTIPHTDVMNVYSNSLAGISWLKRSPNVGGSEGTLGNNKLFEQMLAGIPVIISDLRLWREIVVENDCGIIVDENDIHGFTQAVQFLKNNPEEAQRMGNNGRQAVINKYNWTTQEQVLTELYYSL